MPALADRSPLEAPAPRRAARAPAAPLRGTAPSWAAAAHGAWLWDAHGQRRLDMAGAGGALVLGHADPDVERAAANADTRSAGLAAARLLARLPRAERVAFGADPTATMDAAIAACRRATGRTVVLRVATLEEAATAPSRIDAGGVAAVVVDASDLPHALPHALRALTAAAGALLVFDETVTGLRRHAGGMQAMLGVRADLAVFGPGLANGRPLAAIAGAGGLVDALPPLRAPGAEAFAAAAETLRKIELEDAPLVIGVRGAEIEAGLTDLLDRHGAAAFARIEGDPSACRLVLDHPQARSLERRFAAQLAAHGVHGGAVSRPGFAHGDAEVDVLLDAWACALPALVRAAQGAR